MAVSVFDIFTIGIGPSSSHTVGPMRAAGMFVATLPAGVTRVRAELFGSLGATGHGHGSEAAVLLGLEGQKPETIDTAYLKTRAREIRETNSLRVGGDPSYEIDFDPRDDLILHRNRSLTGHANAMVFTAWQGEREATRRTYFSVGGGFVLAGTDGEEGAGDDAPDALSGGAPVLVPDESPVPYPFRSGEDLLALCHDYRLTVPELCWANEEALGRGSRDDLLHIWQVMADCIAQGCSTPGVLPGGLRVRRRANRLYKDLRARDRRPSTGDPLAAMDWLTLWALAVNEENAAGGRVVTAPTNGAAGIVPAVGKYIATYVDDSDATIADYLLTAGAIGAIYQQTASISGAEVGCQGEVGVASSMAAAGLCQVLGGTPQQITNAAEIGLEHHLGLTCDPVGGLVQIPCIERNAVGAVQAVTAARLALAGDGDQIVSLDQVIRTMMQTGADMKDKYKETARGGLAVNIVEC